MEEEIEILTRYGEADFSNRLHLFLQFPELRWSFQEIELKELAAQRALVSPTRQHHKGKCPLLQSLLGRIFDIKLFKIVGKISKPISNPGGPFTEQRRNELLAITSKQLYEIKNTSVVGA